MEEKRESITKSELIEKISAKIPQLGLKDVEPVSYTHLRAHET